MKKYISQEVGGADARLCDQAHSLIETLLVQMRRGLDEPTYLLSEEWQRLFGAKQSMVANLQKLVSAFAALPKASPTVIEGDAWVLNGAITPAEVKLLQGWLSDTSAST